MRRKTGQARVLVLSLGLALGFGTAAPFAAAAPDSSEGRTPQPKRLYHKSRSFRIPLTIDPAERARLQEVQLFVSDDSGYTWHPRSRTTPDRPYFTFKGTRDGEYWFAVRSIAKDGTDTGQSDATPTPSMIVIVDTNPPSLLLEPNGRRGSVASVRWEVRDENLDLKTLYFEYQAEGAREWRRVPPRQPALIGSRSWDAGTAEPLRVRGTVEDKAHNVTEVVINLPAGTPQNPAFDEPEISALSGPSGPRIARAPDFPPVMETPPSASGRFEAESAAPQSHTGNDAFAHGTDAFSGSPSGGGETPNTASQAPGSSPSRTLLVPSPKFSLQYQVDEAGPNGPAVVELWITRNGGQSWIRLGEDPDRVSPFPVDLGSEGTFGLALVARAASGLGDQPPAPGDTPQYWVEVDNVPPSVQLDPPVVGSGKYLGKVAISWRASDLHLTPHPVTIQWRPDQDGAQWQTVAESLEGVDRYVWTVPPNFPPKFHIRVEAVDTMGNVGSADTTASGAVIVDRTRPRSRIMGVDVPAARNGAGANGRTFR